MDHWETTNKILDMNLLLMLGYSRKNYKAVGQNLDISASELEIATQAIPEIEINSNTNTSEKSPSKDACSEYSGACGSEYEDDISSSEMESSRSDATSGFQSLDDKDIGGGKDTQKDEDFTDDIIEDNSDDEYVKPAMPEWVETWISSPVAVERMVTIMKAERRSERHQLYQQKRQRERCNGAEISTLYSISNPSFLGIEGEEDSEVISYLIKNVFNIYFDQADSIVQDVGREGGFVYSSCILFPETFIHYLQERGLPNYTEAEEAFLYSPVDEEERASLDKEIEEGAKDMVVEDESSDEWLEESDIESD